VYGNFKYGDMPTAKDIDSICRGCLRDTQWDLLPNGLGRSIDYIAFDGSLSESGDRN